MTERKLYSVVITVEMPVLALDEDEARWAGEAALLLPDFEVKNHLVGEKVTELRALPDEEWADWVPWCFDEKEYERTGELNQADERTCAEVLGLKPARKLKRRASDPRRDPDGVWRSDYAAQCERCGWKGCCPECHR